MVTRREWLKATGAGLVACSLGASPTRADERGDDAQMILIRAGTFLMGTTEQQAQDLAQQYGYHVSWLSGETPQRQVELAAYMMDKYPVTNADYARFCEATGHAPRWHWRGDKPPEDLANHPVTNVNKADAEAYAKWAGKRLPTEAEWEKAARGDEGLMFPWGNEFDPQACRWNADPNTPGEGTAPVDAYPRGASPYGVMDMIGNAAEWCGDGPGPGSAYIKGGCWLSEEIINLRPAARNMSGFANNPSNFYSFRCVKEVG